MKGGAADVAVLAAGTDTHLKIAAAEMPVVTPVVGTGWTVDEAIELNVPVPVIAQSLIERLRSRDKESFADKLLASMRNEFGGHAVAKE